MNKQQKIKNILTQLLLKTKKNGNFSRYEIESAIQVVLLAADERTINNWFNLLWKLEIFEQPIQGRYNLCWDHIVQLEVAVPIDLDSNQKRLNNV